MAEKLALATVKVIGAPSHGEVPAAPELVLSPNQEITDPNLGIMRVARRLAISHLNIKGDWRDYVDGIVHPTAKRRMPLPGTSWSLIFTTDLEEAVWQIFRRDPDRMDELRGISVGDVRERNFVPFSAPLQSDGDKPNHIHLVHRNHVRNPLAGDVPEADRRRLLDALRPVDQLQGVTVVRPRRIFAAS